MKKGYKNTPVKTTIAAAIEGAYEDLSALRDEAQEICDNMPESLQSSERYQTFETNSSNLEEASNVPDIPESVQDQEVEFTEMRKKGGESRAVRCSNAAAALEAVIGALEDSADDEVIALTGELQALADEANGLEWPGMFG